MLIRDTRTRDLTTYSRGAGSEAATRRSTAKHGEERRSTKMKTKTSSSSGGGGGKGAREGEKGRNSGHLDFCRRIGTLCWQPSKIKGCGEAGPTEPTRTTWPLECKRACAQQSTVRAGGSGGGDRGFGSSCDEKSRGVTGNGAGRRQRRRRLGVRRLLATRWAGV